MGKIADFFVREIAEAIPRAPINSFEKTVSNQNISGTIWGRRVWKIKN